MPETPKKRAVKSVPAKSGRERREALLQSKTPRLAKKSPAKAPAASEPAVLAHEESKKEPLAVEIATLPSSEESADSEVVWAPHPSGRDRYFEAVGRRKTAIARVRLFTKSGPFTVNDKAYGDYFPTLDLQKITEDALKKMKLWERFRVSARVSGGGIHAQAEAVRHGLARCLIIFNPDFRKRMKRAGFLTRDPRMKERKKFGLKKARRAPQWAKR